jgi:hypothetical protein
MMPTLFDCRTRGRGCQMAGGADVRAELGRGSMPLPRAWIQSVVSRKLR